MTPVEKLEAAIWVLEAEKSAAGPHWEDHLRNIGLPNAQPWNYDLFSTLHRTIDAQLAILRDMTDRYSGRMKPDWVPIAPGAINAVALAEAILGGA